MKVNKEKLWNILEKYDCKEYEGFCNNISRIIQGKSDSKDLLDIFIWMEKIDKVDRDIMESQVENQITELLFSI